MFKDQDKDNYLSSKDKDFSSKDKDKDCIVKDKDQDKDCILVLKEFLRTRTNITAQWPLILLIKWYPTFKTKVTPMQTESLIPELPTGSKSPLYGCITTHNCMQRLYRRRHSHCATNKSFPMTACFAFLCSRLHFPVLLTDLGELGIVLSST